MTQVIDIADRVEVLRLGKRVARIDKSAATVESLVTAMTSATEREEAA